MHQNKLIINKIINTTSALPEWVLQVMTRLQAEVHSLVTYNLIQEKMDLIWDHIAMLQAMAYDKRIQQHALEQGCLHECLLPQEVLR